VTQVYDIKIYNSKSQYLWCKLQIVVVVVLAVVMSPSGSSYMEQVG